MDEIEAPVFGENISKAEPIPMITRSQKALLPAGMSDRLPPEADQEDDAADRILATFKTHGYQRVSRRFWSSRRRC